MCMPLYCHLTYQTPKSIALSLHLTFSPTSLSPIPFIPPHSVSYFYPSAQFSVHIKLKLTFSHFVSSNIL